MPRLSHALIVDPDPKGLETLASGFASDGVKVTSTTSMDAVLGLTAKEAPQVLLACLREPFAEALQSVGRLREATETKNVPIVVLGPVARRSAARALGAEFLPMPVFVRDAITATRLLAGVGQPMGDEAQVQGTLSDYGLYFLLRTSMGLGRSGILQIERSNHKGEIRLAEGEVTSAQVGSLQGTAALHHLLLWEEAALDFKMRPLARRGSMQKRPEALLDEAERFLRDFAHATKDLGGSSVVLAQIPSKSGEAPDAAAQVLRLIDGRRTLGDVIDDSPFRVFDTLKAVSRLREDGVIVALAPAAATGADDIRRRRATLPDLQINEAPAGASANAAAKDTSAAATASASAGSAPSLGGSETGSSKMQPMEQRATSSNRRKKSRKDRATSQPSPSTAAEIHARGEIRAAQRSMPVVVEAPSMVIDLGPTETSPAPEVSPPAAIAATAPAPRPVPVASNTRASSSGGLGSIQVDAGLMADLETYKKPTPVVTAPAPTAAAAAAAAPVVAAAPAPLPAPGAATPVVAKDKDSKFTKRRPSIEFDPLEADFFAREAELYKSEKADNFDDLEPGPSAKAK